MVRPHKYNGGVHNWRTAGKNKGLEPSIIWDHKVETSVDILELLVEDVKDKDRWRYLINGFR